MRRRHFLGVLGGAAATWPLTAWAQQPGRTRRIAILESSNDTPLVSVFLKKLADLGWLEGRNLQVDIRFGRSDLSRAREFASELITLKPDMVFATNTQMVEFILNQTRTIPIVFVQVPDPIGSKFVTSFAHPGGNVTGFTNFDASIGGKWLEFLKDTAPSLKRVLVLLQTRNPTAAGFLEAVKAAAPRFGMHVLPVNAQDGPSIDAAMNEFTREPDGGVIVPPSALAVTFRERIIALCEKMRLPAIYPYREFADTGGLISYGFDRTVLWQSAALYVDRILKGEKVGDLPVQTPTKFELVINLKTAKAFGLTIPESFLLIADHVIE